MHHIAEPVDRRCAARWWQRIASPEEVLAADLSSVHCARDLPGRLQRQGVRSDLADWTIIFDGEPMHHSKPRGWAWAVGVVVPGAWEARWYGLEMARQRELIRRDARDADLLVGAGPHTGQLRLAKWILRGDERQRLARLAVL